LDHLLYFAIVQLLGFCLNQIVQKHLECKPP